MKKFMIFAVCALMSVAAQAVEFGFAEVDRVAQQGNAFYAYTAGGESVKISALQYKQMQNATGYYILSVDGEKTIAAGDEFTVEKLTADSVGLDGNSPKVFFTNGTKKTFTKSEWLKTLKGQTVRRIYINTPTWEFENFATMEGEFACHSKVAPVKAQVPAPAKVVASAPAPAPAPAPAKVEAPAKVVAPAPAQVKVEAPAPTKVEAPKAPAQSANGNIGGITFKITH